MAGIGADDPYGAGPLCRPGADTCRRMSWTAPVLPVPCVMHSLTSLSSSSCFSGSHPQPNDFSPRAPPVGGAGRHVAPKILIHPLVRAHRTAGGSTAKNKQPPVEGIFRDGVLVRFVR
jgi:hypothetical protein